MKLGQLMFSHQGRINCKQWWFGQAFGLFCAGLIGYTFHISIPHHLTIHIFSLHNLSVGAVIGVFLFTCHFSMNMKRWHDLNRKGWYAGLCYIPVFGLIISVFVLGCLKGQKGANEFGDVPEPLKLFG